MGFNGNNCVKLDCRVISEPKVQQEYGLEIIYSAKVECERERGRLDIFTINFPKSLGVSLSCGQYISLSGSLRSYSVAREDSSQMMMCLVVFVDSVAILDKKPSTFANVITLKSARLASDNTNIKVFSSTVTVANIIVSVEDRVGRRNYIPCAIWNNYAKLISDYETGTEFDITGKLKSHTTAKGFNMVKVSIEDIGVSRKE